MFDPSKFTIVAGGAGGPGGWRLWHYVAAADETREDMVKPGYFAAAAEYVAPGDIAFVLAPRFVDQLAFAKVGPDLVAVAMAYADMPEEAEAPAPQVMPGGSGPTPGQSQTAEFVEADEVASAPPSAVQPEE